MTKKSPRAPREASRTPLWRLKTPPGRVQDASRTLPRRLQIVSKARLLLISLSGPQNYPQMASKNNPRCSQNAPSIQTDRPTETQRHTDRQSDKQLDRQTDGQADKQRHRETNQHQSPLIRHLNLSPATFKHGGGNCEALDKKNETNEVKMLGYGPPM